MESEGFKVLPVNPQRYNNKFPLYQKPVEIGNFSVDGNRQFHNDDHQKKYIVPCPPGVTIDLNIGYDEAIKRDFLLVERLDHVLHWIINNRDKVKCYFPSQNPSVKCINADFVCFRGLLTQVACTPYERQDDWIVCATKFKGTIYMYGFPTEQKKQQELQRTERNSLMSFWGYKFEQYMTADSPQGIPDAKSVLNTKSEYCCVLKGKLEKNILLFSAEVDGIDTKMSTMDEKVYGELKTSRLITSEKQDYNFCRFKLIHWWAQSFLVGIPRVICGFRNDDGIVEQLHSFKTREIPHTSKKIWLPNVAINFLHSFLECAKEHVVKDDPNVVYQFYWKPNSDVMFQELTSPGEFKILPSWYIDEILSWAEI